MNRPIDGLKRAAPGCTCKNYSAKGRNEAREPPPDLELGDPHALGTRGDCVAFCDRVFWQRRRQSLSPPLDRASHRGHDWRPRAVGRPLHSLAFPAVHSERPDDSRPRASGYGTAFFSRGSTGGAAHRFVLGPENLSQRTSRGTAAYSHPSRQERLDELAGTAALHFRKQAAARDALRPAHPPRKASERLDSLQRSADAARDGGKRSAAGAGRRRIARPSTLSRESRLAVRTVHGDAKSSPASEYFREIHVVA